MPANGPHTPVMPRSVAHYASAEPGQLWVDCTVGYGGHTRLLLDAGARVIGIDQDPDALAVAGAQLAGFIESGRLSLRRGNFADLDLLLDAGERLPQVDGVLADLGVSSAQLDRGERGFSFDRAGPIDMRMNPDGPRTALDLLLESDQGELTRLLRTYGEEPLARPIARALRAYAQSDGPFDTRTLAAVVINAMPARVRAKRKRHPATQTFQALRMAVNDELGVVERLLDQAPRVLAPGGRIIMISFHSLEDRLVKHHFATWAGRRRPQAPRLGLPPPEAPAPTFELLTRRVARPVPDELDTNPRARSARLRAARKLERSL